MWLSWKDLFQITWSAEIWDEVFRNYSEDKAVEQKFRQTIHDSVFVQFGFCSKVLASGFQYVGLPDKDDEHIVALARQESCSTIVTLNLKDFPQAILNQHGVSVCSPDLFLGDLLASEPDDVKEALQFHLKSQTQTKPKKAFYFEKLKKAKVPNFASKLEAEDIAGNLFSEVWS